MSRLSTLRPEVAPLPLMTNSGSRCWASVPADALAYIINECCLAQSDVAAIRLVCVHWRTTTNSHLKSMAPACTSLEQVAGIAERFPYLTNCDLTRCDTRLVGHASLCRDASARLATLLGALSHMPSLTCLHISDTFSERMGQKHWASLVCAQAMADLPAPPPPPPLPAAPLSLQAQHPAAPPATPPPATAAAIPTSDPSPEACTSTRISPTPPTELSPTPLTDLSPVGPSPALPLTPPPPSDSKLSQQVREAASAATPATATPEHPTPSTALTPPCHHHQQQPASPPEDLADSPTAAAVAPPGGVEAGEGGTSQLPVTESTELMDDLTNDATACGPTTSAPPVPQREVDEQLSSVCDLAAGVECCGSLSGSCEMELASEEASREGLEEGGGQREGEPPVAPFTPPAPTPPHPGPPPAPLVLSATELADPGIKSFARAIGRPGATHQHAFWLPDWCGRLTGLQELHIRGRQRPSAGLPPCLLWLHATRTAPQLTSLTLCRLGLATLPEQLQHLTGLTRLVAQDCSLSLMPRGLAAGLSRLEVMDLSLNGLTSLPSDFTTLTSLRHLDLQRNKLASLPPDIGRLTLLTALLLNHNQLRTLPPSLASLRRVAHLSCSYNWLGGMGAALPLLCGLPGLRRLELACVSDVRCRLVPPQDLRLLSGHLTHLDLAANNLVPGEVLGCLTSLRSLVLSDCGLLAVPPWVRKLAPCLVTLDLSNNSLSELPCWLSACSRLRVLSIAHNRLSLRVPPAVLESMPQLTVMESE